MPGMNVTLLNALRRYGSSMNDEDLAKATAAVKTVEQLGYTYEGGQLWKPPLGEAPAYITWDGEGVPPAGTVCEFTPVKAYSDTGIWEQFRVAASVDGWVFGFIEGLSPNDMQPRSLSVSEHYFRQIMTPEEREAQRKEKSVKAMVEVFNSTPGKKTRRVACKRL